MKVLLILTGGTISMVRDAETGALHPADMQTFKAFVPELFAGDIQVEMIPFEPLLDSSDLNPESWIQMAQMVYDHYDEYDGFVILHGTDTMSYSASALSFIFDKKMVTGYKDSPIDCGKDIFLQLFKERIIL